MSFLPKTTVVIFLALSIFGAQTASAATIATNRPWATLSGLVGYWSFNGPDFTDKVYDKSGGEVRIYNRALSASEVKKLYQSGR